MHHKIFEISDLIVLDWEFFNTLQEVDAKVPKLGEMNAN